jgi:transcriptional regulator with XRE-family HTH domain
VATVNEPLRRALLRARLREDDVAARLGVDPKTVRRWLNGRLPYPHNRAAIAELVGADEAELWPDAGMLYRPLGTVQNIEIRLHRAVLYNAIYRADDQLLVNQHAYGIPAAQAPVFCLSDSGGGEMAALYLDSFERVWGRSVLLA